MKKQKFLYAALFTIISAAACTKIISTEIGVGELIPPVDGVTVKDTTLDVIINTYGMNDAAPGVAEVNLLGTYNDPDFGKTRGDVYMQVQPTYYPYRFAVGKDSIRSIDSVVLVTKTLGRTFGDSTVNAGFRIYEVNDASFTRASGYPFNNSKTFMATNEISYNNMEQFVNPLSVNDSIKSFGDTVGTPNQMRLRLNNSIAQKLINIDTASYRTDSLFRLAFHGIKIASTSGNVIIPVIPYGSGLLVYYKYTSRRDGSEDTTVASFAANPLTSASANNIVNNYSGTLLSTLPMGDTSKGAPFIYLQAAPGTYARAKIPALDQLPNMLIYRAELIMDEEPKALGSADSTFIPNLFVSGVDNGKRMLLRDAQPAQKTDGGGNALDAFYTSNIQLFGTYPIMKKDTGNGRYYHQYNFQLTHHVQEVVKKVTPNYPLDVFAPFQDSLYYTPLARYVHVQASSAAGSYINLNYPGVHRAKVYGNNTTSSHKVRLHIVYAPL